MSHVLENILGQLKPNTSRAQSLEQASTSQLCPIVLGRQLYGHVVRCIHLVLGGRLKLFLFLLGILALLLSNILLAAFLLQSRCDCFVERRLASTEQTLKVDVVKRDASISSILSLGPEIQPFPMNEPHQVPVPFLQEEPNCSLLLLLCGHPHLLSIFNDLLSHHGDRLWVMFFFC